MIGTAKKVWEYEDGRAVVRGVNTLLARGEKRDQIVKALLAVVKDMDRQLEQVAGKVTDTATKKQLKAFRETTADQLEAIQSELMSE